MARRRARGDVPTTGGEVPPLSAGAPSPARRAGASTALGLLAFVFYAVHGAYHAASGHLEHLLWACHLGTVLVGIGLCTGSAAANTVGVFWLVMGNALWLIDLASGAELLPTSLLTHVGGLLLGSCGLVRLGIAPHAWWQAVGLFFLLQQVTRLLTPPEQNVNIAFAVWSGWEDVFPSYYGYAALLNAAGLALFFALHVLARRLLGPGLAGDETASDAARPADRAWRPVRKFDKHRRAG